MTVNDNYIYSNYLMIARLTGETNASCATVQPECIVYYVAGLL